MVRLTQLKYILCRDLKLYKVNHLPLNTYLQKQVYEQLKKV